MKNDHEPGGPRPTCAANMIRSWRIVAKLDPDKVLSETLLKRVLLAKFDALIVGGTQGITRHNTLELLNRVLGKGFPVAVEVSTPEVIVPGPDIYLVPLVLNSQSAEWIVQRHQHVLAALRGPVDWGRIVAEGYVVTNPNSAVAQLTDAMTQLDSAGLAAYVDVAGRLMRLPVIYIESSGVFGDIRLLEAARRRCDGPRLFYGGGVDTPERAAAVAQIADTVVIGNAVYDHNVDLLAVVEVVRTAPRSNST